jgi:hypothetical protein
VAVHPGVVDTSLANDFFKTQVSLFALSAALPLFNALVDASKVGLAAVVPLSHPPAYMDPFYK